MTWLLIGLLGGCGSRVYTPPLAPLELGLAESEGDHWGILEQAAGLMDTTVRQRSLSLLVQHWPEPGAGPWAGRGLGDPSPYVQRKSIDALGTRLEEEASRNALIQYLQRSDVSPFNTAKAAILLSQDSSTNVLGLVEEHLLEERHHSERAPLLLAAAYLGSEQAPAPLAAALRKGDFPLEMEFFLSIGDRPFPGLTEALVEGLGLFEEELHLPIAYSLIRLDHPAGERLFREALKSKTIERQHEALDFLNQLLHPTADRLLRRDSKETADHARLIQESRRPQMPRFAVASLESPDRELRLQALQTLLLWNQRFDAKPSFRRQVRAQAAESLRDLEASVQREALRLMGTVGTRSDAKHISPFLGSEDPSHRVEAAGALLLIELRANGGT